MAKIEKEISSWIEKAKELDQLSTKLQAKLFEIDVDNYPYREPNRCSKCGKIATKKVKKCPFCGNTSFVEKPKKIQINNHFNGLINNIKSLISLVGGE